MIAGAMLPCCCRHEGERGCQTPCDQERPHAASAAAFAAAVVVAAAAVVVVVVVVGV